MSALDEVGALGDALAEAGGEVVEHGHLVAGLQQVRGDDAADIARAAGDQVLPSS